jgi:hypothetical protein
MKKIIAITFFLSLAFAPSAAFAYTTKQTDGSACNTNNACHVYCNNGTFAGTMYWNGSQWSDGVRSDSDKDVVASAIVRAQGTSCA